MAVSLKEPYLVTMLQTNGNCKPSKSLGFLIYDEWNEYASWKTWNAWGGEQQKNELHSKVWVAQFLALYSARYLAIERWNLSEQDKSQESQKSQKWGSILLNAIFRKSSVFFLLVLILFYVEASHVLIVYTQIRRAYLPQSKVLWNIQMIGHTTTNMKSRKGCFLLSPATYHF